jgi:hypothetical protein
MSRADSLSHSGGCDDPRLRAGVWAAVEAQTYSAKPVSAQGGRSFRVVTVLWRHPLRQGAAAAGWLDV